jgi:hypothetical protein
MAACPGSRIVSRGFLHWTSPPRRRTARRRQSADSAIQDLVALIEALPRAARRSWNDATSRTFDIGIEAGPDHIEGEGSRAFEDVCLEPGTVRAVARVNGRILVTVYPHTREAVPRAGWEAAARRMHAAGHDRLLMSGAPTIFERKHWTW